MFEVFYPESVVGLFPENPSATLIATGKAERFIIEMHVY